jgi:valyl-tRNA synthetase
LEPILIPLSGVVKITPSHDLLDFDLVRRHRDVIDLPTAITYACIDECGRICEQYEGYGGMDRFEAREKVRYSGISDPHDANVMGTVSLLAF